MKFWWLLIGIVAGGPIWLLAAVFAARRVWRNARRLSARAKGREQLLELGQLAGGLAHEIKNPLSTINVNLELLAEDLACYDGKEQRRWLSRLHSVQDETVRLNRILEDFLHFAGRFELSPQKVDLRSLIEELVDFFEAQANAGGVIMRTALPDVEIPCNVDSKLIKQAMLNLMINAVQAMSEGGELLVKLSVRRGQALVEIIDTGIGISPAQAERVFDVYYSTKTGGSGLGLPTTLRIVKAHHGQLTVDSEPGKGTRFVIALPLAD